MRYKLAALVVLLQVVFFLGWAAAEEGWFDAAPPLHIRVHAAQADPRDYLSGQYLALSYEFSTAQRYDAQTQKTETMPFIQPVFPHLEKGQEVWVVLRREGEFYIPDHTELSRPKQLAANEVTLRGSFLPFGWPNQLVFGLEKYFIPEGTSPFPPHQDISVELAIFSNGRARIRQVYLNGKPWP